MSKESDVSLQVIGPLGDELLESLLPACLQLRESRPSRVRLYIHSEGGSTGFAQKLLDLLRCKDARGVRPEVIGIVPVMAASAATDLFLGCDHLIAFPGSKLHFHGTRYPQVGEVTAERAEELRSELSADNEAFAFLHARGVAERLAWIFQLHRVQANNPDPFEAFLDWIEHYPEVPSAVRRRYHQARTYLEFLDKVELELDRKARPARRSPLSEAYTVLETVTKAHRREKVLADMPLEALLRRVSQDTLLLFQVSSRAEAWSGQEFWDLVRTCFGGSVRNGRYLPADLENARRLWTLAYLLLRDLYEGENPLDAEACYWLGLVHEIAGEPERYPNLRSTAEAIRAAEAAGEAPPPAFPHL